jgi:signal transduction histidine kinase
VVADKSSRKPVSNFMIKRSLQTGIILQILFIMILTSILTSAILAWFYNAKSQVGSFYYMSNDVMQDLELTNVLGIILPALIVAQAVSLMIAFTIGLVSSRKVAVPIYKIEKWASQLRSGNLNTRMVFREKEQRMTQDLTRECNAVVDYYKAVFSELSAATEGIDGDTANASTVRKHTDDLKKALARVHFQ